MKQKGTIFLVILVLLASMGAWAEGGAEKPVIRFATNWLGGNGFEKTSWEKDVYAFGEARKDKVTFKWELSKGDDLRTKIKTDLAANNLPDLFSYWTRGSIKTLVDEGKLMEVHDYLKLSKSVKWEDFPLDGWKAYSFDGGKTAYGFPIEGSTAYFLANKKLFQKFNLKYPTTQAELLAVAKVFVANDIVPLSIGSKGGNPAHFWVSEVFFQYGNDDMAAGFATGAAKYNTPEMVKAAQLIEEQRKAGVFPRDTLANGDFGPAVALYNERKAAMIMCFPWMINSFSADIIADSEYIYPPTMPGAKNPGNSLVVGGTNYGLVVNAKSFKDPKKQALLTEFLDFYMSDAILNQVAASGRWVDKNMKIDEKLVSPLYLMAAKGAQGKHLWINLWTRMPDPTAQEVYSFAADELWAGSITPQQYADKVQKSIDEYLAKNK